MAMTRARSSFPTATTTSTTTTISITIGLSALILLVVAGPAEAMRCRDWVRFGPDRKATAVEDMIQDSLASNRGREINFNRDAIGRCLYSFAQDIEYAFDDACANARTSGMGALRSIFKDYIWTCVN